MEDCLNKATGKRREPWIDIAKGILILFVLLGHVNYFAHDFAGTDDFEFVTNINVLFSPWYMPAFFVITGYCTNFDVPFKDFALKNFKSLIIPSILIGVFLSSWIASFFTSEGLSCYNFLDKNWYGILLTCGPWFLTALFVAKIIMYGIRKWIKIGDVWIFLILLLGMLVSCSIYNKKLVLNIWYFEHALMLLPFLFFGSVLKKHSQWLDKEKLLVCLGLGFILVAILMKLFHLPYPYIVGVVGMFWGNFWLCFLMGVSGSLMLFVICRWIGKCGWLEYLGKHTITIYLLQESIMVVLIKGYLHWQVGISKYLVALFLILFTAFVCAWLDVVIDKHARFLKGKF